MDEPEELPAAPSARAPIVAIPPAASTVTPTTGKALYCWACGRKAHPHVNRIGKARGFPRLMSDWTPSDVAVAWDELNGQPAAAGQRR
jgi:hypothetical protein